MSPKALRSSCHLGTFTVMSAFGRTRMSLTPPDGRVTAIGNRKKRRIFHFPPGRAFARARASQWPRRHCSFRRSWPTLTARLCRSLYPSHILPSDPRTAFGLTSIVARPLRRPLNLLKHKQSDRRGKSTLGATFRVDPGGKFVQTDVAFCRDAPEGCPKWVFKRYRGSVAANG